MPRLAMGPRHKHWQPSAVHTSFIYEKVTGVGAEEPCHDVGIHNDTRLQERSTGYVYHPLSSLPVPSVIDSDTCTTTAKSAVLHPKVTGSGYNDTSITATSKSIHGIHTSHSRHEIRSAITSDTEASSSTQHPTSSHTVHHDTEQLEADNCHSTTGPENYNSTTGKDNYTTGTQIDDSQRRVKRQSPARQLVEVHSPEALNGAYTSCGAAADAGLTASTTNSNTVAGQATTSGRTGAHRSAGQTSRNSARNWRPYTAGAVVGRADDCKYKKWSSDESGTHPQSYPPLRHWSSKQTVCS
eukprot:Lankesteria_metandrocarpae@DN275_c0_g1_i1.p1